MCINEIVVLCDSTKIGHAKMILFLMNAPQDLDRLQKFMMFLKLGISPP